jgi:hypothetical protein
MKCVKCGQELCTTEGSVVNATCWDCDHYDSCANSDSLEYDEDDFYDDDREPDAYYCIGCGHYQSHDGECDRCCGYSMAPVYY